MKKLLYTIAVLCALVGQLTCQNVYCNDDGDVYIDGLTTAYDGKYVKFEDNVCPIGTTVVGGAVDTSGCSITLDSPFNVWFISDSAYTLYNSGFFTFTCKPAITATAYFEFTAETDFIGSDDDILAAYLTATASPSSLVAGSQVTVTVALDSTSQEFYTFAIWSMSVEASGLSTDIVTAGCPAVSFLNIAITGTAGGGQTSLTVVFDAFLYQDDALAGKWANFEGKVEVSLCELADTADCYEATGCSGDEQFGRKRRQTENTQTMDASFSLTVFSTEQSRQTFLDSMRAELGMTEATKMASIDDICVPKTTSVVVLVFLIAGMVLCFLATIWMFVKLRKSRRLQEPDKPEFSYPNGHSNKSFKR